MYLDEGSQFTHAKHFNLPSHKDMEDMKIHIAEFIHFHPDPEAGAKLRDQVEMYWIHRLHASKLIGMNTLDGPPVINTEITCNWRTF